MNQFLLALCGLPSSGKSALADEISAKLRGGVEIVRTDEWRDDAYYDEWEPEREGNVRKHALSRVAELIASGKSVIHDDTNYYKSMRHELFEIALRHRCVFAVAHVATPVEVAVAWNSQRENSPITEEVIRRISERFDRPGGRYLWDQPIAEINMAADNSRQAVSLIVDLLGDLPPATEPRPVRSSYTAGEEIDVLTRRIVSEFLEENPELRTNIDVTLIRRSVLAKALQDNLAVRKAGNMLRKELRRLLQADD